MIFLAEDFSDNGLEPGPFTPQLVTCWMLAVFGGCVCFLAVVPMILRVCLALDIAKRCRQEGYSQIKAHRRPSIQGVRGRALHRMFGSQVRNRPSLVPLGCQLIEPASVFVSLREFGHRGERGCIIAAVIPAWW